MIKEKVKSFGSYCFLYHKQQRNHGVCVRCNLAINFDTVQQISTAMTMTLQKNIPVGKQDFEI